MRYVGVVQDIAVPAIKPSGFGAAGENWSADGWLLPVQWEALELAVRPKDLIGELGQLLPAKYSPLQPVTGNGNQKAYLTEVGKPVFDLITRRARVSALPAVEVEGAAASLARADSEQEDSIRNDPNLDSTTKQQVILARQGQGLFRRRVLEIERACRLTKVENHDLLVASHIKPWRACGSAAERLDGANGLALAPHVDRLFDRGLISFESDGTVLISPKLDQADLDRLGLRDACRSGCGAFQQTQAPFLSYHRTCVYRP
ncbi:HNH endonuclease [Bradyrhizobium yuanmingense]|uniref:HNH endonuclease n=1 Tax=Bradyrhizobium yuanmingense TaxID=108015 RepID=UPI000AAC8436|nr:HNH endonuclease signature motif containing protein [Bradyrhizobium yuanmingense]